MKELSKAGGVVLLFILIKIIVFMLLKEASMHFLNITDESDSLNSKLVGLSTFISSIITLVLLFFWKPVTGFKDRWRRLPPFIILLLLVFGFLGIALNSFVLSFFIDSHQEVLNQSKSLLSSGVLGLLSIVILVPIVEELVFRCIVIECLVKVVHPAGAIVLSALVFGVLHGTGVQVLGACLLGLVFGWIYYQTRSVLPSILLHVFNNGFFMYSLFISSRKEEANMIESIWSIQYEYGWYTAGISLCILILLASTIKKLLKHHI